MSSSFVESVSSQTVNLDLTRALAPGRELSDLCTDLFLIVIRMREAEDLGDPASLRKLISFYLGLFEKNCTAINVKPATTAEAKYALVALLDETVLSIPGACRDYWISRPLQLDLFGDNMAGAEFFRRLDHDCSAAETKRELLEVYYLCLSLGFEGRYKLADQSERSALIQTLGQTLRRVKPRTSAALSPHGVRDRGRMGATRKRTLRQTPLWFVGSMGLALLALTWGLLFCIGGAQLSRCLDTLGL